MKRLDIGARNNMVMEMAASIIYRKIAWCESVAELARRRGQMAKQEEWLKKASEMRLALKVIDENAGCWD
jgi:hypothetical protein